MRKAEIQCRTLQIDRTSRYFSALQSAAPRMDRLQMHPLFPPCWTIYIASLLAAVHRHNRSVRCPCSYVGEAGMKTCYGCHLDERQRNAGAH